MIKQIRLEREHFGCIETNPDRTAYWDLKIVITPNWVSNRHWAVHKSLVSNREDFENEGTVKKHFQLSENDEMLFGKFDDEKTKILFPETKTKHIKTNEIETRQKGYIKFRDYDNDHEIYLDSDYIELFKVTELWGACRDAYINKPDDPTFIIMPCNL